jgi:hypothetical protein
MEPPAVRSLATRSVVEGVTNVTKNSELPYQEHVALCEHRREVTEST